MANTIRALKRFLKAGAAACGGPGARGGDQRDARCAQRGGVYGVGKVGDGMEGGGDLGLAEEGRLIHLGRTTLEPGARGRCLLVDLGGGSCEVTLSEQGRIKEMVSLPLGAVRLQQECLRTDLPEKQEIARLRHCIDRELRRAERKLGQPRVSLVDW